VQNEGKISCQDGKVIFFAFLSIENGEMVYLNNIELAPHNIGGDKRYDYVAGCLIAYGCLYGHRNGVGNYKGFVCFDSKTALINHLSNQIWRRTTNGAAYVHCTGNGH